MDMYVLLLTYEKLFEVVKKGCFNMNTEEFLNYTGDFGPSMTGSCRPGCITGM